MTSDHLETPIVFVYGALRSGTTLFRLMLNAHPGIANSGEADFLFDYITPDPTHPTGWRFDRAGLAIDWIFRADALELPPGKDGLDLLDDLLRQFVARAPGQVVTLNLHRNAERLIAILPEVRLIHILRDPRDVARSSISMGWAGTLYHGVGHWIATERGWDRIADTLSPGQAMTLKFRILLGDLETNLRAVCGFLGVSFDPAMLKYHKSTSYDPPDASLVDQWRRLSPRAELAQLESRAADLMIRRGYPLSGPVTQPGTLERLGLWIRNKTAIWRFGLRRFGPVLFIGRKIAHRLGVKALDHHLRQRMDAITLRHLK
ncbi:MAG: sulfotransferase family protein [Cypionkella sp.]